jgi:hypothetical protein
MQVDKAHFPINTMDLQQPKVLVRPHQAEATKGKNVVIWETKPDLRGKELICKFEYEKTLDSKETFKVIVSASEQGGKGHPHLPISDRLSRLWPDQSDQWRLPVRPVYPQAVRG